MKCFWCGRPAVCGTRGRPYPYLQDYPCFHLLRLWSLTAYGTASGYAENSLHGLPFQKADKEEQITAEVKFMKKLASRMTVPEHCISGRPVVTHLTSTRLRDVILYNKEYEPALYEKMKGSIEALSPFIPAKDNADNALPDVFISRQDWENPRDTFDHQVVILNAKSKKKQQFWWDYLKLNIF